MPRPQTQLDLNQSTLHYEYLTAFWSDNSNHHHHQRSSLDSTLLHDIMLTTEYSLSGKNLANNGHSRCKCGSLAEPPEASAAGNCFLEGAGASESDFARILSGFWIILYLPKVTFLKVTCLTYVIIVATWWKVGWTSEIPNKTHFTHKFLVHIEMKPQLQHP